MTKISTFLLNYSEFINFISVISQVKNKANSRVNCMKHIRIKQRKNLARKLKLLTCIAAVLTKRDSVHFLRILPKNYLPVKEMKVMLTLNLFSLNNKSSNPTSPTKKLFPILSLS